MTSENLTLLKEFRTRMLKSVGAKNSWGKNDLAELIRDQYTQILEKETVEVAEEELVNA